jgi:PIG-X / PBN1
MVSVSSNIAATDSELIRHDSLLMQLLDSTLGAGGSIERFQSPISTPNWWSIAFPGELTFREDSPLYFVLSQWYSPKDLSQASSFSLSYGYTPANPNLNQVDSDLVIELYWPEFKTADLLIDRQTKDSYGDKVEIGMLSINPTYTKDNIWALGGLIRTLGSVSPEKTLFNYAPKHIQLTSSYYHGEFESPIGLHPKYDIKLMNVVAPQPVCKLYAKCSIPNELFLDQYQLADLDRSSPQPATGKLIGVWGETDLEDPVWSVASWGSEALIQIYLPPASQFKSNFSFTLPMHSRYEFPQPNSTLVERSMPWPLVFWACQDLEQRVNNDVVGLSYESLFPEDTLFYHLTPHSTDNLVSEFTIPVAPLEVYSAVSHVTVVILFGGFIFLLYKIIVQFVGLHKTSREKLD